MLLEGLEVAFIVITFGASAAQSEVTKGAGLTSATLGALAAMLLVLVIGLVVHAPLRQVPENTLKFVVGLMLTTLAPSGPARAWAWPGGAKIGHSLAWCWVTSD